LSSFFQTGYGSLDTIEKNIEERKAQSGKLWRFRMKAGETKKVIFLDDNPPIIEEHQLKLDGKWGNFYTCLKNLGQTCPLCEAGDRPATTGFYTVIDRTEYTVQRGDNAGQKRADQLRVMAVKFKGLKQFKKFSAKYKGLAGCEFEADRTSDKAASVGDMFVLEEKHDEDALLDIINAQRQQPIEHLSAVLVNWEEYLAPRSAADLAKLVGGKAAEVDEDSEVDFD